MSLNIEYFISHRENNNNYPLLIATDNCDYEFEDDYIEDAETMGYALGSPIPRKPVIVDYHSSPYSVISDKIAKVIEEVYGIQLIPAIIEGKDNEIFENYYYLHIYNNLPVLDMDKSEYKWMDTIQQANPIEKLVLNEQALSEIPLENRLIFRLKENSSFEIFHKSIVDKIMTVNPVGIKFTCVTKWDIGTPFD